MINPIGDRDALVRDLNGPSPGSLQQACETAIWVVAHRYTHVVDQTKNPSHIQKKHPSAVTQPAKFLLECRVT